MNPGITIQRSGSGIEQVQKSLSQIERSDALVGIPQEKNTRGGEPIGNAALLYIHTNGSPIRGIPARPVIEPAIAADGNRQVISKELSEAARAIFQNDPSAAYNYLRRAGMAGRNAAASWFTDARNNWAPNTPSTIRRKGSDKPLIDTGALRRAITFVVRQMP